MGNQQRGKTVQERCRELARLNPHLSSEEVYRILRAEGYQVSLSSVRSVYWPRARGRRKREDLYTVKVDWETLKRLMELVERMGCRDVSEVVKKLVQGGGSDGVKCLFRDGPVCTLTGSTCNPSTCPLDRVKPFKGGGEKLLNVKHGGVNLFKKNKEPVAEQMAREFQTLLSYCRDVETLKSVRDRAVNTLITVVQMMTEEEKARLMSLIWPYKPEPTLAETVTTYVKSGERLRDLSRILAPFIAEVAKGG